VVTVLGGFAAYIFCDYTSLSVAQSWSVAQMVLIIPQTLNILSRLSTSNQNSRRYSPGTHQVRLHLDIQLDRNQMYKTCDENVQP